MRRFLVIHSFQSQTLQYSMIGRDVTTHAKQISFLDKDIVVLLDRIVRQGSINGIGIDLSALGGFVSSRVIVTTVMMFGYANRIPIVQLTASESERLIAQLDNLDSFFKQNQDHLILPEYRNPVDVTRSKRVRRFSIGR